MPFTLSSKYIGNGVPARWDDLSEGGYGVSLLNDRKCGYDVQGRTLRLTLLNGYGSG